MKWHRVTRKRPCKVCGKFDWCGYLDDAAICMRVESDTPTKNGGWLHRSDYPIRFIPRQPAIVEKPLDVSIFSRWLSATDFRLLDGLAMSLGVDAECLRSIGCAWASAHQAWAFPMKDAQGKTIGIRLRNNDGRKWAVKGSKQGLFIPEQKIGSCLFIVEGPTDLSAALTLGLFAIGRPACLGQEEMIQRFIQSNRIERAVIVTDNDTPGLRGAEKLQSLLPIISCIWVPPVKDIREFLLLGGTKQMIEASINDLVWTAPRSRAA